jgi:hypothetical protein
MILINLLEYVFLMFVFNVYHSDGLTLGTGDANKYKTIRWYHFPKTGKLKLKYMLTFINLYYYQVVLL